jgi:hypothetical protein
MFVSADGFASYKDSNGRLYRPRVRLTEHVTGKKTMMDRSEKIIYFDVYIPPIKKYEREVKGRTKAGPPEPGEKITFIARKVKAGDLETVREFKATVNEIQWGELHFRTADGVLVAQKNNNLGVVEVLVNGSYDRSLVVDSDHKIHHGVSSIPM